MLASLQNAEVEGESQMETVYEGKLRDTFKRPAIFFTKPVMLPYCAVRSPVTLRVWFLVTLQF